MIRRNNRINVSITLTLGGLIFAAILASLSFSPPRTAFARNEPHPNLQAAAPGLRAAGTQLAPGNPLTLNPAHIYLPIIVSAPGGPGVSATPAPTQPSTPPTPPAPTTTPPTPPSSSAEALFLNTSNRTTGAATEVDAAGGFHLAYVAYGADASGHRAAYYAFCAASCGSVSNWATASLGDNITEVQLALTAGGHPRLLLRGEDASYDTQYQYAACDANCTQRASWSITIITTSQYIPVYLNDYALHYFALDPQDRPRFVYRKNQAGDAFYIFCDAGCTSTDGWWEYPIDPYIFSDPTAYPTLAFTSTGQPRIAAFVFPDGGLPAMLEYFTCDTACENPAHWLHTGLIEMGSGHPSTVLRLDSNDQPRMIFNQGSLESGDGENLVYLWCDTNCADSANWGGSTLGLSPGQAEDPDLALDSQDRPRVTFESTSPNGLGYAWCDASCESAGATWEIGLVESSEALESEWPMLPPASCTASYWYGGYRSSLALDPAGNPRIGYVGQHYHGGGCTVKEDYRTVRFVFFNRP